MGEDGEAALPEAPASGLSVPSARVSSTTGRVLLHTLRQAGAAGGRVLEAVRSAVQLALVAPGACPGARVSPSPGFGRLSACRERPKQTAAPPSRPRCGRAVPVPYADTVLWVHERPSSSASVWQLDVTVTETRGCCFPRVPGRRCAWPWGSSAFGVVCVDVPAALGASACVPAP